MYDVTGYEIQIINLFFQLKIIKADIIIYYLSLYNLYHFAHSSQ